MKSNQNRKNLIQDKNTERVDFNLLHNLIDDLQLNFDGISMENQEEQVLKDNKNYIDNFNNVNFKISKNKKTINSDLNEEVPLIHQKHIDKVMSASFYPETLSRSFELELFKKYIGKVKQEKFKENIRNNKITVDENISNSKNEKQLVNILKRKNYDNSIKSQLKITSFVRNLNQELGRMSNFYGKESSLDRFIIEKNLYDKFENQDNLIAYRNKKINLNNIMKHDKKIRLKPLIVKSNKTSVEKLANNMFRYSKKLILKNKLVPEF
jgi:hypothetical protein